MPNSTSARTWPLQCWYVAARTEELGERPLGRTICNERMVFFRGASGTVSALTDFCPHRGAPLSLGFVRDGDLVCGYHGLTLGCSGHAVSMPGQNVRGLPVTRKFAVVERYGFIWVWPGPADLADETKIPHLHWAENPAWAYGGGTYHIACDYRLMVDNLMDLTHETYVHGSSIGQHEIDETPVKTRREADEIITEREMTGIFAPPFWQKAMSCAGLPADQPVDRWQSSRFSLPSHVLIDVGVAMAGEGGRNAPADRKTASIVVDFITPETETSHHYFWGLARQFAVDDTALTAELRERQGQIFAEDVVILERQQSNLSAMPDQRLVLLNIDAGGARARQLIEQAIAAEAVPSAQEMPEPAGGNSQNIM